MLKPKTKGKSWKQGREKAKFSFEARGHKVVEWYIQKEKGCQQRILRSDKLSFQNESKRNTSPDKQRLREFVASKQALG